MSDERVRLLDESRKVEPRKTPSGLRRKRFRGGVGGKNPPAGVEHPEGGRQPLPGGLEKVIGCHVGGASRGGAFDAPCGR